MDTSKYNMLPDSSSIEREISRVGGMIILYPLASMVLPVSLGAVYFLNEQVFHVSIIEITHTITERYLYVSSFLLTQHNLNNTNNTQQKPKT